MVFGLLIVVGAYSVLKVLTGKFRYEKESLDPDA
jgi:hypothetical protein